MTHIVYRLAADRRYAEIPAAIRSRSSCNSAVDDLQWTDSYGSTALHLLCQARCVTSELIAAVQACVQALPTAVQWANAATWTPLHFAVHQLQQQQLQFDNTTESLQQLLRVELIILLLAACPAAVSERATTGYKSKTAFHMAVEVNAPYDVLAAMLNIDPSLATATYLSPKRTRTTYYCSSRVSSPTNSHETPLHVLWKAGKSTSKMALLLEAAHTGKVTRVSSRRRIWNHDSQQANQFLLLHAACSMEDCPRSYFEHVLQQHLKQCVQADEKGLLPIHILLRRPVSVYQQFCLQLLLAAAPQAAAVRDPSGRLPLHIALATTNSSEHGVCNSYNTADVPLTWHKGGLRELTYAHPPALRVADPVSKLVPFLAAATASEYSKEHLSTTFELLLAAPEMLATLVSSSNIRQPIDESMHNTQNFHLC
jgi:hypothetical protein